MFKSQIKEFHTNFCSSLSMACACASFILLLMLEIEGVDARLIWIPHTKDVKEASAKDYQKETTKRSNEKVCQNCWFSGLLGT